MSETAGTAASSAAADAAAPEFSIVRGNPTPAELAAVTAVITGMVQELSTERARRSTTGPSAWERSQKPIRSTLTPGYGAWRTFSG